MLDHRGLSKGSGFVAFSTPEEAAGAVTEMSGKMIGRKPLYVDVAQCKEERRARPQACPSAVVFWSSREPRGFTFVQFVDPYDAGEAQYHMNGQLFCGREITVVVAAETRKRPEEMRHRGRPTRGPSGYGGGGRRSYYGRSCSRSLYRSRSPRYPSGSRGRYRSRSNSPAPRRKADYSVSPRRRPEDHSRSPLPVPRRRLYSPGYVDADRIPADGKPVSPGRASRCGNAEFESRRP
ncbi:hypothetical protein MKW98_030737 [Papaver atlanticum]|uniref:RRM domain-containing protein n=1 Tax=Papaver atlanticum TaxID=357466 RepID=A0AAD4S0A7_9MAGN|nr:hypothetical protein MKW98_030737 [Papaver atlanticum]